MLNLTVKAKSFRKEGEDLLKEFIQSMVETSGLSGFESKISLVIEDYFRPLSDDIRRDKLGNLIILKKGNMGKKKKIYLAAHMDEIGLMVKQVDEKGFIKFTTVGGVDQRTLLTQEVVVHGKKDILGIIGNKPPHLLKDEDKKKAVKMEDMLIDVGLPREEVLEIVSVGDPISFRRKMITLENDRISSKSLDDRAGVAVMYECIKELNKMNHDCDVFAVATVQEEVGLRGAITSTYNIFPDIGIAIDVGFAHTPELSKDEYSELGKGPGIGFGANIHPKVHEGLIKTAKEYNLPHQEEFYTGATGTDAWAIQVTQSGVATGLISIPLRYMHTSVEVIDINDIKNAGKILANYIVSLNSVDLEEMLCY